MPVDRRKSIENRSLKKTAMCSIRLEPRLKEKLQATAKRKDLSLSSLIELVLREFLESQNSDASLEKIQEDRRQYPRKEVILPARWRFRRGQEMVERDVLIKNISAGGAYTEYMNGQIYRLFDNKQVSSLELAVRLPGFQKPVIFACETVRFHITSDYLGVGLRYSNMANKKSIAALNRFLT